MKKTFSVSPAWCLEVFSSSDVDYDWSPTDDVAEADGWVVLEGGDTVHTRTKCDAFDTDEDAYAYAKRLAKKHKGIAVPWVG